jgi:hypothetical protein
MDNQGGNPQPVAFQHAEVADLHSPGSRFPVQDLPSPGQNPKARKQRRPYVKTPARVAASCANLLKARAAPKEKIYRPTAKRQAANRANLGKAHARRRQELENIVEALDAVFPPLSEAAADPEAENAQPAGLQRCWVIGWPSRQGVDRNASGCTELEKTGAALLDRLRGGYRQVRRESRQVMGLLTRAAQRTVAPNLQEILALAWALISVLVNSRVLGRLHRENRRIQKLLAAFLQRRYGATGEIFDWEAELRRAGAFLRKMEESTCQGEARQGVPAGPARKPRARLAPQPEGDARQRLGQENMPPHPETEPPLGPNLPATCEEFRALLGRAFLAPSSEPEEEAVRVLLDELARKLWAHLHMFEVSLQEETRRVDEALNEMAQAIPTTTHELLHRRCRIEVILKARPGYEQVWRECNEELRQCLGIVMKQRYGPDPEIDRFCQAN